MTAVKTTTTTMPTTKDFEPGSSLPAVEYSTSPSPDDGDGDASTTRTTPAPPARPWILDSGMRRLNFWMFICFLSSFASGYDGSFFSGLLTIAPWFADFGYPDSNMTGVLGMSAILGLVFGPWVSQWLADRIGRPRTMLIASTVMALGGGLTAVYIPGDPFHQRAMWICARVIVSLGSGAGLVAAPALMTELAHPRQRAVVVSLFWCGFYFGSVTAAWTAFGCNGWASSWAWRLPSLLQAAPVVPQLLSLPFAPESPRWLVAQGRDAEAQATLAHYHAAGDEAHALVASQMAQIRTVVALDAAAARTTVLDLFRGRANRMRMWIICVLALSTQWVGNAVITYYLPSILATVGVTDTREQAIFNGCLQVFNLVISCLWATQVERFGRRILFITSGVGMLASFVAITALSARYAAKAEPAAGRGVIACLFIFYFFYDVALTPLAVAYPAELMPYHLRSKGLAVFTSGFALCLVFNTWANPVALAAIQWKLYLVYIAVIVFFLLNALFVFPETKGKTPEQLDDLFDGQPLVRYGLNLRERRRSRQGDGERGHDAGGGLGAGSDAESVKVG